MSNIGLSNCLKSLSILHKVSDVGDRKVLEMMEKENACIGGEDSGHLIFKQDHTTGDGMLSAIKLIQVLADTRTSLSKLSAVMTVYPQVLLNVEVCAAKPDFMTIPPLKMPLPRSKKIWAKMAGY